MDGPPQFLSNLESGVLRILEVAKQAKTAKKRRLTAKQKKATSARMKALWAARRKKQ